MHLLRRLAIPFPGNRRASIWKGVSNISTSLLEVLIVKNTILRIVSPGIYIAYKNGVTKVVGFSADYW